MKKNNLLIVFLLTILFSSCNNKKMIEVVEVPLPAAENKLMIGDPDDVKAVDGVYKLDKLPYKYDALIPHIDAATMEIHYSKHYVGYTNKLNKLLAGTKLTDLTIEELVSTLDMRNENLRNNAGGYYNHNLFWKNLKPKGGGQPKDTLASAIIRDFGSFGNFESIFKDTANKHFGSGWAWLITDKYGRLQVSSTENQDNPLMSSGVIKGFPILALDVWEHAYYLNYQNKRASYVDAFFNLIDWEVVENRYKAAIKK